MGEFRVSVIKEEVVAAMLPMQDHWLPFSNLDLLLPPIDASVFFCYNNTAMLSFGSMMESLKNSLAKALVPYYAFAGEVVQNSMGEPELLCNNRGVDFVVAEADVELRSLNLYNPDESVEGKLVPKKKRGVLAVQVTWLKCGGLVVGCTSDHRIADAYSTNMFLVSWAQLAQSTGLSTLTHQPCFRRSLLSPRRPPTLHPSASIDRMYVLLTDHLPPPPEPNPSSDLGPIVSRIYFITVEELNRIQALATSSGVKPTKLVSFSAFLWKLVATASVSSKTIIDGYNNKKAIVAKMGIVVDGRRRLSNGDKKKEALMNCYFGNVVSIPFDGEPVEKLAEKTLSQVAEQVHEFLEVATTEEHFLGLNDWVEIHRPVPAVTRIFHETYDGPCFVVSSGRRFLESKVDFGWGKPIFESCHFPWGGGCGYVMPLPSPKGNGDWVLYLHLHKNHLEFMESHYSHIFRPLSWDYLSNQI
ncbi:hypothetical protein HN51_007439 [Arachis hypogaea]|uniref:coniferyl alcohol acyltransferase-like n=1 Tax=Arachis hypogaea TaxID=3818 RepID=UPI000DEC2622|nr:shikimate O-hydroxycinnamoyltransferase-like [Arachis hypogaea]